MARLILPGGQVVEARAGGQLEQVYRAMGAKPDYGTPPTTNDQIDEQTDKSETEETVDPSSSEQ